MAEDDDISRNLPNHCHGNGKMSITPTRGRSSSGVMSHDTSMTSHDMSAAQHVSCLKVAGYLEELQWLEAYLMDEARDRTVDGELSSQVIVFRAMVGCHGDVGCCKSSHCDGSDKVG